MEKLHYLEDEDKLVVETQYDPSAVIEENKALRAQGDVVVGSKGQEMLLAARIDLDHVVAMKNMGYDLFSPDPFERRRALCFIQAEQNAFMTTDKKVFSLHTPKWQ